MAELVEALKLASVEFKQWWQQHDANALYTGVRILLVDDAIIPYEYTSLILDEDRHLRLVVYAEQLDATIKENRIARIKPTD